jgi:hypothetical protein
MLFGSSWIKIPPTSILDDDDDEDGKAGASQSKKMGSKDDEWFVLKEDENVVEVAAFSKPSISDPSFEIIGNEEQEDTNELPIIERSYEECHPLSTRSDQLFQTVEQMWAQNSRCLSNEKWRALLILLLCSVVAKLDLFHATKQEEEEKRIPVPFVLVDDDKPSPVYEAYIMMPPQPQHHQSDTKPITNPYGGIKSTNHPYRPANMDYETLVGEEQQGSCEYLHASKLMVQQPKENPPEISVMATKTIYVSTSPSQRPAKPMAISLEEFGDMKAGGDVASVNQTDSGSSAFIDPRPRPSPAHAQQDQSPDDDIIRSLSKRIAELQAKTEEYLERLTQMTMETNSWRSRALSCDQELASIKTIDEELSVKSHRPAKGGSSMIPIPTVPEEAWNNHGKNKYPMASNAFPDSEMYNASIPYVGDVTALEDRSSRPVGSATLIPSPA